MSDRLKNIGTYEPYLRLEKVYFDTFEISEQRIIDLFKGSVETFQSNYLGRIIQGSRFEMHSIRAITNLNISGLRKYCFRALVEYGESGIITDVRHFIELFHRDNTNMIVGIILKYPKVINAGSGFGVKIGFEKVLPDVLKGEEIRIEVIGDEISLK